MTTTSCYINMTICIFHVSRKLIFKKKVKTDFTIFTMKRMTQVKNFQHVSISLIYINFDIYTCNVDILAGVFSIDIMRIILIDNRFSLFKIICSVINHLQMSLRCRINAHHSIQKQTMVIQLQAVSIPVEFSMIYSQRDVKFDGETCIAYSFVSQKIQMMQLSARSNLKFIVNNCSNIAYRVKFYRTHLFSVLN